MSGPDEHPVEVLWRLQQEAMAAGHELPQQGQDEPMWTGLAFAVGQFRLATELTSIIDVVDCPSITPLPGVRPWLRGICNVRGKIYSVVDLGLFLNIAPPVQNNEGRVLVVNSSELGCALLVSKIFGLRHFVEEQENRDISVLEREIQLYAERAFVHDDILWGVLDLERLVTSEDFLRIERNAGNRMR